MIVSIFSYSVRSSNVGAKRCYKIGKSLIRTPPTNVGGALLFSACPSVCPLSL